jgi:hypothetical protein
MKERFSRRFKRIFTFYLYMAIPIICIFIVMMLVIIGKYIYRNQILQLSNTNCVSGQAVLVKSNEGYRFVEFKYDGVSFKAQTTYSSHEPNPLDNKIVNFYFLKDNPEISRIEVPLEKESLYLSIYTLVSLFLLVFFLMFLIKKMDIQILE